MQQKKAGFTFVELIIVLVIITILSTIGFVTYESYLGTGRDTARIVNLKGLHQSLGTYATQAKLPLPEEKIDLLANTNLFAYQGVVTNDIASLIGFKGDVYDKQFDVYPTYMLGSSRKDYQLLTFLEDRASLQTLMPHTYAFVDYQSMFPTTIGKPLGILLDSDTLAPIETIDTYTASGSYDIITGSGSFSVYFSDMDNFDTSNQSISQILPNQSCKRILEMGKSQGDGVYTISPTGSGSVRVYCDMRTDGGGWSIVVNNDNSDDEYIATAANTCYPRLSGFPSYACGSPDPKNDFVTNAEGIEFTELVWGVYEGKFSNLKTYRYLEWNDKQVIPNTSIFQIPVADNDRSLLRGYETLNLIYCGSSLADARYIETGAPANSFPHNPATIIGRSSYNNGKISFTDARLNDGATSNSYGFDDFQDGQSCSDNYSDKAYKGYSSYIMIR